MFIDFINFQRITQASLVGAALVFSGLATAAQAKSPVRAYMAPQANAATSAATTNSATRVLPNKLKTGINNLSGKSFGNVRVHHGSARPANAGAKAFTQGGKIHIAPGQARHLPHELNHVVHQNQGRVRPQLRNSRNLYLEREADALNDKRRMSKSAKSAKTLKNTKSSAAFAKRAKSARTIAKGAQSAKVARHANSARKTIKAANTARKVGKAALMGTGVGAVVGVTAGLAGVDPVDMAVLKATNPAAYNRKMAALKKNPVKYMGNNIKNNTVKGLTDVGNATIKTGQAIGKASKNVSNATKKAASNVGKATRTAANKVGCGVGNVFKKKGQKKKC